MNFLCDNHQQIVLRNNELARKLWLGAFQNGVSASQHRDWKAAVSFFGTAYEIGVLRLHLEKNSPAPSFTAQQAVTSGRCLANVMSEIHENFSAETYLKEIFEILSDICLDKDCSDVQRLEAFSHLQEFRNRLVEHLQKQGQAKFALEINASFVKTNHAARSELVH